MAKGKSVDKITDKIASSRTYYSQLLCIFVCGRGVGSPYNDSKSDDLNGVRALQAASSYSNRRRKTCVVLFSRDFDR